MILVDVRKKSKKYFAKKEMVFSERIPIKNEKKKTSNCS